MENFVDAKSPFFEHLGELRKRLIFCFIPVLIGIVIGYSCYNTIILDLLRGPLDALSNRGENPFAVSNPFLRFLKASSDRLGELDLDLHYIGPLEGFLVKLKASFFTGIILAFPFIFYQLWRFISAGLKKKERRTILLYFPISLILFLTGILFAYFIMLPTGLYFLVVVASGGLKPMLIISKYTSLVILLSLAFGVIFEIPLIILFLTKIKVVSPKLLAEKRKYAILLMFILSAVLTPPDIFTQFMMAIPVIILYEVSILLSKLMWSRSEQDTT